MVQKAYQTLFQNFNKSFHNEKNGFCLACLISCLTIPFFGEKKNILLPKYDGYTPPIYFDQILTQVPKALNFMHGSECARILKPFVKGFTATDLFFSIVSTNVCFWL